MTTKQDDKAELARRWKELLKKFDRELREKGLSDAEREALLKEILDPEDVPAN